MTSSAYEDCMFWIIYAADLPSSILLAQSSAQETGCSGFGCPKYKTTGVRAEGRSTNYVY